jgi:hypothetical protein
MSVKSAFMIESAIRSNMYQIFYIFPVADANVNRFLQVSHGAAEVYRRYGAGSATMRLADGRSTYGCVGLLDLIHPNAGEQLFITVDSFRDGEQFRALSEQIDADPQIGALYGEMCEMVDLKRVVRWEADEVGDPTLP